MDVVDMLRSVQLFAKLDDDAIRPFGDLLREKKVPRGSRIVSESDPGDTFFIVREGRVKVMLASAEGKEMILAILGPGECFGELALIDGRPRTADVVVMEPTRLFVLRREDFVRRVEASPALAWSLLVALVRRLRGADAKIHDLALLEVPGRVARVLLDAEDFKSAASGPLLTHQTIADLVGASRETVSRTLSEFRSRGLIRAKGRRISVLDREALQLLANPRL